MSIDISRRYALRHLGLGVAALLTACGEEGEAAVDTAEQWLGAPVSLTDWKRSALRLQHRGHNIVYHSEGAGPAVLLLHGFPTSSFDYASLWVGLRARHQVITYDMIGYGLSNKPTSYAYSLADQADIAEEVCAALGVSACQVLCHDVGDTVCQELLARQLEGRAKLEIERVMLLNGGLFPETHRPTQLQQALLGPLPELTLPFITRESFITELEQGGLFGPDRVPPPEVLDAMWELIEREDGIQRWPQLIRYIEERQQHRERWVGALIHSPVPLRLIDGALDPVSGRHMVERYLELIPEPDVIMLDDVSHFPQLEAPKYVLEQALSYFRHGI